jgi:dynein heavy chain, axonemal
LCQEMSRYNKLLLNIRKSLHEIEAALAGRAAFSAESEASKKAIERNAVPEAWKKVSYPSLKPFSSYFDDLLERCSMLETWDRNGKPPAVFWISGFFFAQSFLTAALQNYSRKHKLPVDEIAFDFEPIKGDVSDITEPPEAGVYVSGLFLEGCGWDEENMQLVESEKNVLHSKAPIFWFKPRKADEIKQNARYDCPCYRTAERRGTLATTGHSTNFVMHVKMPTKEPAEHWIKRGVALVTQLSE